MPDTKITALTAIGANPIIPSTFPIPMVDLTDTSMAASGTTKKVTVNQILGAGGTATLASATITGDLTVDTSTLKVDSATDRVGVGTTTPSQKLEVATLGSDTRVRINSTSVVCTEYFRSGTGLWLVGSDSTNAFKIARGSNFGGSADYFAIAAATADCTWYDGAGGTRMTLNSTGLGVGVASPATKLDVNGGTGGIGGQNHATFSGNAGRGLVIGTRSDNVSADRTATLNAPFTGGGIVLQTQGTDRLTIDSSGNVGIGVTPSAWGAGYKALQLGDGLSLMGSPLNGTIAGNAWFDGTNWKYITANPATLYYASFGANGSHVWSISSGVPSAGGNVSLTNAMTLDASGNLLVGTTTNAGVRLDVQTTTGNCIGRVKSNAAASTASFIIDYVETLGCTYIKKAGSDVWIYGVQNDTSATPSFKINTASNVGVQLVSGATAWTTLSDETVKDIIEPISNAIAKVGSIRSVIGKFKTDDSNKRRSFLIAQDVQSVLPEAVDVVGENNELGLRYTEVIPLLVAAIKELTARVQTLETR